MMPNPKQRLLRWLLLRMALQDLANMVGELLPSILEEISGAAPIDFLCHRAETVLPPTMAVIDREGRVRLMNALVPLAVSEFPLVDLDLLTALEKSTPAGVRQTLLESRELAERTPDFQRSQCFSVWVPCMELAPTLMSLKLSHKERI